MHYFSTAYQLKKGLTEKGRVEMIRRIKINFKYIFTKFTLIVSIVFGIISGIQIFADWNTGIVKKCAVGEYPKSWIGRSQAA